MHKNRATLRFLLPFIAAMSLFPVRSACAAGNDGSVVLRMCKGADKVKALSVMCHSYLNGFMDGAHHYGKVGYCLEGGDKEKAPGALVDWITAHPEAQSQPAGLVLHKALSEKFPCKGKR